MRITQLFPYLRIWIRYLHNDLYTIPCTNDGIDPGNWEPLHNCLDVHLCFTRQPASTAIPIGSTLVSVRHQTIASKSDLRSLRLSHKRIWMRVRGPTIEKRKLTEASSRSLAMFKHSSTISPLWYRCDLDFPGQAKQQQMHSHLLLNVVLVVLCIHQLRSCCWFPERFSK